MDSEKALELVKHGVTLLFLDVPQYTMVAIDTQVLHSFITVWFTKSLSFYFLFCFNAVIMVSENTI